MSRYSGDVTLPDGRQFYVVARFGSPDYETNSGGDLISTHIEDVEGNELDANAYNEEIPWPTRYDASAKDYLWSVCVDLVCQQSPDEPDDDWL